MEINEFIENLADQFDDIDVASLTPTTVFKELEDWTSLVALSVIAMIDEEYDVLLKGEDIRNASTIEDLFNTVKSKQEE